MAQATSTNLQPWAQHYLEEQAGAPIKHFHRSFDRFGVYVLFQNGKQCFVEEGAMFQDAQFIEEHKPLCASCGENAHTSYFDFAGRCSLTLTNFWKNTRKVFWHRYLKNHSLITT